VSPKSLKTHLRFLYTSSWVWWIWPSHSPWNTGFWWRKREGCCQHSVPPKHIIMVDLVFL